MNLLLDTHALLWWLADDGRLSKDAREVISKPKNTVFVSAASAWEISIKRALGKLEAPENLTVAVSTSGFKELGITIEHALAAGQLPDHHMDPFDRMLVAQATIESLTVVTRHAWIVSYQIPTIRA